MTNSWRIVEPTVSDVVWSSGIIEYSLTGTKTTKTLNSSLVFKTAGTYDFANAELSGTTTLINESGGAVTVRVRLGLSIINTGPMITVEEPAVIQSVTLTGGINGSRIQIYDLTSNTELANASATFPYTWTDPNPFVANREIRVRVMFNSGVNSTLFLEQTIGTLTNLSPSVTFPVSQQTDTVYETNNINGSLVTGVSIDDGTLRVNVSTGAITWPELYAYETFWLSTEVGIRDEGRFAVAPDTANYIWYNFKLKNTTSPTQPLVVSNGYGRDGDTGTSLGLIDTTGGTIILAPDIVIPFATGSGLSPEQDTTLNKINTLTENVSGLRFTAKALESAVGQQIETGFNLKQSQRLILSSLVGKLSGADSTTVTIRDINDTVNRIVATVDANGNRTAVTKNVS